MTIHVDAFDNYAYRHGFNSHRLQIYLLTHSFDKPSLVEQNNFMKNLSNAYDEISSNIRNYRCKKIDLVEFGRRSREIDAFIIEYVRTHPVEAEPKERYYREGYGWCYRWIPFWERPSYLLKYSREAVRGILRKVFKQKKRIAGLHRGQISTSNDFDDELHFATDEELTDKALTLRRNLFRELDADIKNMKTHKSDKR